MRMRCPKHNCAINIPEELLGTTIRCPRCGSLIVVDKRDLDRTDVQFKPGDPSATPESEAAKKEVPDLENQIYDGLPPLSVMIALRKRQGANYDAGDFARRYVMTADDWKALDAFETVLHAAAGVRVSTVLLGLVFAFNVMMLLVGHESEMPRITTTHPALQLLVLIGMGGCLFFRYQGQAALSRIDLGWTYELLQPVTLLLILSFGLEVWIYLRPMFEDRSFAPGFSNLAGALFNAIALLEACRISLGVRKAQRQVTPPEISHRLIEALRYLA